MKTNDLINRLTSNLRPVKIVKFSIFDVVKVVSVGIFCVFAAIVIRGIRSDFSEQILSIRFVLESGALIILGLVSIFAAFSLSIPSIKNRRVYIAPFSVFLFVLGLTFYSFLYNSNPFLYLGHGFSCVYEVIATSVLPASLMFYFVRKAAVLKRDIVGVLVLLSGISFGLLSVQLTCVDRTSLHLLLWHVLPALIIIFSGIFLSRKILNKI